MSIQGIPYSFTGESTGTPGVFTGVGLVLSPATFPVNPLVDFLTISVNLVMSKQTQSNEHSGRIYRTRYPNHIPTLKMKIIAYTYDADIRCAECAIKQFAQESRLFNALYTKDVLRRLVDENGIPNAQKDSEGNFIRPVFSTDEMAHGHCGDCRGAFKIPDGGTVQMKGEKHGY